MLLKPSKTKKLIYSFTFYAAKKVMKLFHNNQKYNAQLILEICESSTGYKDG